MQRALALAQHGWGKTHPNPMVGALIVQGDTIVSEAWHEGAGQPHAEALALAKWTGEPTADTRLYLSLEPCSTQGRTPPCTQAILESGIRQVKIAALDPNPLHAGRGIDILRQAGLEVEVGILAEAAAELNLVFNHWIVQKTPLIAAKSAITLDGRTATRNGHSQWITGENARKDVMRWRRYFPAIAVGSGTVLKDNPRLTSREEELWCPIRFVFDRQLRTVIDPLPHVYSDRFKAKTIVITSPNNQDTANYKQLEQLGVTLWTLGDDTPQSFWKAFRQGCVKADITGVYFEGGTHLLSHLLSARQMDYLFVYQSPQFFADEQAQALFKGQVSQDMDGAFSLKDIQHAHLAPDTLTRGFVVYPGCQKI